MKRKISKAEQEAYISRLSIALLIVAGIVAAYLGYQMMGQTEQKAQDKWDDAWMNAQQHCKEVSDNTNNTCNYYGCLAEIYPTLEGQTYLRLTEQNCLIKEGMK